MELINIYHHEFEVQQIGQRRKLSFALCVFLKVVMFFNCFIESMVTINRTILIDTQEQHLTIELWHQRLELHVVVCFEQAHVSGVDELL